MSENILILIIIVLIFIILYLFRKNKDLKFQKRSQIIKTGKWIEDYFPFLNKFPVPPETFKFIGEPIDGVAFAEKIFFIEFKTGNAKLSEKQEKIKKLVENKQVEWREIRIR